MFLGFRFRVARHVRASSTFPLPPNFAELTSVSDTRQAREWIASFKGSEIPKEFVDWSFARSSGPGGQNVNKVNTKATARCSIASKWIPLWARAAIRKSSFFVPSTQTILMSSSTYRSQSQNIQACLSKLHSLVLNAASTEIPNETPEAQKKRVIGLERAAKERNRRMKQARSALKKSRKGGWE